MGFVLPVGAPLGFAGVFEVFGRLRAEDDAGDGVGNGTSP